MIEAGFESAVRTTIFTGRPLRALSTPYVANWEKERQAEIRHLTNQGIIPIDHDLDRLDLEGKLTDEILDQATLRYGPPYLFQRRLLPTMIDQWELLQDW